MLSFSRSSLLLAAALFAAPAAAQSTCGLCPSGETFNTEKPFFQVPGTDSTSAPSTCGGFDDLLSVISADQCQATLESQNVLSPIDLQYYCECSGVSAPGVCDLCGAGGSLVSTADEASDLLNGYTCRQFNDLVASIVDTNQCQQAVAAAELCCAGGAIATNATDDDAAATDDAAGNGTAICPICADGSAPTSNTLIPTINVTCSSFAIAPIPTTACDGLTSSLAVGALCGCPGETAPLTCPLCGGAAVPDANADLVVDIGGASLTCTEAVFFAQYAGDALCNSAVAQLDEACCGAASDVPSLAPTFPGSEGPTVSPSAGSGTTAPSLVSTFEPSAPPTASGAGAAAPMAMAAAAALAALAALA